MAAGLGFKTFTTGEVLTAADVNGYLMQGVLVFADAAARTSAITSPQEGQYSFLKDTNALEYYDGASWVGAPVGDITAVNAGTGISGGGSSGSVTITNSMATEITAKGDLIVGTGNATFDNLPAGTNGYTLVADSGETTGLKWAAPAGGGKVLQVVTATYATQTTTASTTYADTGLTATITPSLASSKVLILVTQSIGIETTSSATDVGGAIRLLRDSTGVFNDTAEYQTSYWTNQGSGTFFIVNYTNIMYLDSPNTTSATTYKTQGRSYDTAAGERIKTQVNSATSVITLLEIGA